MTNDIIKKFTDWAQKEGWAIKHSETLMELLEEVTTRYNNIPKQWMEL